MQVRGDGVSWFDADGRATLVPHKVNTGRWHRFEMTADLDQRRFSIAAVDGNERRPIVADQPMADDLKYDEYNSVVFVPSGPDGSACYVDDFTYEVSNPFANATGH